MYRYVFDPQALKDLKKLSPEIQKRILTKLEFFLSSANPLSFAKSLTHHELGQYRFRTRDYRVIFDLEDEIIVVLAIGHRKDIYR